MSPSLNPALLLRVLFLGKLHASSTPRSYKIVVSAKRYSQDDRLIPRWDRKFLTRFKNFRYNNDAHDDKDVTEFIEAKRWDVNNVEKKRCEAMIRRGVDEENDVQSGFEN